MRSPISLLAVLLLAALPACERDSSGLVGGIGFPALDPELVQLLCVRGDATKGQTKPGEVTASDCDAADIDTTADWYFETWRVRVSTTVSVTFDASSDFDNYLDLWRLNADSSITPIDSNDNRSTTDTNALITATLEANRDYLAIISGFDYSQTGPYTLQFE
jgi:hypothetical protein